MYQIYHNPRCGKSRQCLAYIETLDKEFEVIKYLETPPTIEELNKILKKLNITPLALVRQKEKIWIDNFKSKALSNNEIIEILSTHPILIERPIVIIDKKAFIARDHNIFFEIKI